MRTHTPQGVILIFLVLIVGGASLAAAAMLARGSLAGLGDASGQIAASSVREVAFGCLDEAFLQIQKDPAWAPASVSIGSATCAVSVMTVGDAQRRIAITATDANVLRGVVAEVTVSPFSVTQITEE